jgi:hypothetical protein
VKATLSIECCHTPPNKTRIFITYYHFTFLCSLVASSLFGATTGVWVVRACPPDIAQEETEEELALMVLGR